MNHDRPILLIVQNLRTESGKPTENGMFESFNGRLRDDRLNANEFASLDEARIILETWRHDYNHHRQHGSLGNLTPGEFAEKGQTTDSGA